MRPAIEKVVHPCSRETATLNTAYGRSHVPKFEHAGLLTLRSFLETHCIDCIVLATPAYRWQIGMNGASSAENLWNVA